MVLITGFASLETAIEAIREGAYDYITKPFKMEEMKIVVKNAGEQIRLLRENRRLLAELQEAYEHDDGDFPTHSDLPPRHKFARAATGQ